MQRGHWVARSPLVFCVLSVLPASRLPPPVSATHQPQESSVLIHQSMSFSWFQPSISTRLTQDRMCNLTVCTDPCTYWSWLPLGPCFLLLFYLRPLSHYKEHGPFHLRDLLFLSSLCFIFFPHILIWLPFSPLFTSPFKWYHLF